MQNDTAITEQKMPKTATINTATAKLSQNPPPRGF